MLAPMVGNIPVAKLFTYSHLQFYYLLAGNREKKFYRQKNIKKKFKEKSFGWSENKCPKEQLIKISTKLKKILEKKCVGKNNKQVLRSSGSRRDKKKNFQSINNIYKTLQIKSYISHFYRIIGRRFWQTLCFRHVS